MANVFGVHSVGESIAMFLRNAYPQQLRDDFPATFQLISSSELADPTVDFADGITLLLYRATISEHVRNARPVDRPDAIPALALDLHYLMSAWSKSAQTEQVLLAWASSMLHQHAILDASSLTPDAGWSPDDAIHIVPSDISTEDMMRVWEAMAPPYRVSLSYTARVVRLDGVLPAVPPRVVARRLALGADA
jgi:hypothetical protein